MEFRPQQKLALEFPGNVAISAGAGSGKTRVLVEKYFRLLADEHPDWPVGSVVAITFTVKAASELRSRIAGRIAEELAKPGLSSNRRARLVEMRRDLAGAPIGTIHNYCARLLRDYAVEASLDPDFVIIEGVEESVLRREAVETALAEAAATPKTLAYNDLLLVQLLFTRRQLFEILETMLRRRVEFAPLARRFEETATDDLFAELKSYHAQLLADWRQGFHTTLEPLLTSLEAASKKAGAPDKLLPALQAARACNRPTSDWKGLSDALGVIREVMLTKDGTLRKATAKKLELAEDSPLAGQIVEVFGAKPPLPAEITGFDRENLEISCRLARLFLRVEQLYGQSRDASVAPGNTDHLDFSDLEIRAESVLRESAPVREAVRKGTNMLIIDEFQDTSPLQWEIVRRVVADDSGTLLPSRFFMVGDPKQSIYGFRQAGGRLFDDVRKLVEKSNPAGLGGCRGLVSMNDNFRTKQMPLEFVNGLFAHLMQTAEVSGGGAFEPLNAQRTGSPGGVEIIVTRDNATDTDDESDTTADPTDANVSPQAAAVAERIAKMLGSEKLCGNKDDEDLRAVRPGDIAVLFRKRKHFPLYEAALRARGIAFATHRGQGLYQQPEVLAALAVLRAAAKPRADLPLAEVLRGHLVNMTDDLLFKIALFPGRNLAERCRAATERLAVRAGGQEIVLGPGELERLTFALDLVEGIRKKAGLVAVEELLQSVLNETGLLMIFGATDRGRQVAANMERLLQVARDSHTMSIMDFLDFVDEQAQDPQGEGEASLGFVEADAVKIMTIHAAKGLEFPVVFLPELGDKLWGRTGELVSDGSQWFSTRKSFSLEKDPLFLRDYFSDQENQRSQREEVRVFYVGATRCRDYLCLVLDQQDLSPGTGKRTRPVTADYFRDAAGIVGVPAPGELPLNLKTGNAQQVKVAVTHVVVPSAQMVPTRVPSVNDDHFERQLCVISKAVGAGVAGIAEDGGKENAFQGRPLCFRPQFRGVRAEVSVTQLLDFLECRERFFRRHVVSLPDPIFEGAKSEARRPLVPPSIRGALIHEVLGLQLRQGPDAWQAVVESRLSNVPGLTGTELSSAVDAICAHVTDAVNAGLLAGLTGNGHVELEKPYVGMVEGFALSAIFDAEYQGDDGREIADFKSDEKPSAAVLKRYETQMQLYMWLLSRSVAGQLNFTARLLFTAIKEVKTFTMTRSELDTFGIKVSGWLGELRTFSEQFCHPGIEVDGTLFGAIRDNCRASNLDCRNCGGKGGFN
ncbi:MAG: UvrD-helicase domain-containing protein [Candidatus Sumerlaeaceae bacterium]|nr:UvrD-helicase domain-containing protein [Candidatus Sumerlaeaceae bacterium]